METILEQIDEQVAGPIAEALKRLNEIKAENDSKLRGLQIAAFNEADDGLRFWIRTHLARLKIMLTPSDLKGSDKRT